MTAHESVVSAAAEQIEPTPLKGGMAPRFEVLIVGAHLGSMNALAAQVRRAPRGCNVSIYRWLAAHDGGTIATSAGLPSTHVPLEQACSRRIHFAFILAHQPKQDARRPGDWGWDADGLAGLDPAQVVSSLKPHLLPCRPADGLPMLGISGSPAVRAELIRAGAYLALEPKKLSLFMLGGLQPWMPPTPHIAIPPNMNWRQARKAGYLD
jgi:hypothetical protein